MKPAPLQKGNLIGVMAPGGYVEKPDIELAKTFMESQGYRIDVHAQTFARRGQMAGTAQERADAFHDLVKDPEIRAIWAAGGGNGVLRMLPLIDFDLIKNNPKQIIGFSDVTALLNAIYAKTGLIACHGSVFKNIHNHKDAQTLLDLLAGEDTALPLDNADVLKGGEAHGPLLGGNLSVFQALIGTDYMPDTNGAILFFEDCNEELSRMDRMLCHFKHAGILKNAAALLFGQFKNMSDSGRPFGFTIEDIIREHTSGLNVPVIMNAPFGHGEDLFPLPVGSKGKIDITEKTLKRAV